MDKMLRKPIRPSVFRQVEHRLHRFRSGLFAAAVLSVVAGFADMSAAWAQFDEGPTGCALCVPAHDGDLGQVAILIGRGANVNAKDLGGLTPLMNALDKWHSDVALLLLKHHANPNTSRLNDFTALMLATLYNADLVKAMIEAGADVNAKRNDGYATALHQAATKGGTDMIQVLLSSNADPNARIPNGFTVLDVAIYRVLHNDDIQSLPDVKLLLAAGANPNISGLTEAHNLLGLAAGVKGNKELLALLLAYGAKLDIREPLLLAKIHGQSDFADLLINAGAKIDQEDRYGNTALNLAIAADDVSQLKLLLTLGADPDHLNGKGKQPIEAVLESKIPNQEMIRLLLDNGTDLTYLLPEISRVKDPHIRRMLRAWVASRLEVLSDMSKNPKIMAAMHLVKGPDIRANIVDTLGADIFGVQFVVSTNPKILAAYNARAIARPLLPGDVKLKDFEHMVAAGADNYSNFISAQAMLMRVATGLATPPPVPAAARQHEIRGQHLYREAETPSALMASADEYEQAARLAPWVAAYQRNLCVIDQLSGALGRAYSHCMAYLTVDPPDADDFRKRAEEIDTALKSLQIAQPSSTPAQG